MQSYTGTIRLFPNTQNLGPARFRDLRAAGAFLVSAAWDGTAVTSVSVLSEKEASLRLLSPWGKAEVRVLRAKDGQPVEAARSGDLVVVKTAPGERYRITKA
jgi:hypothetical protein